MSLPPVHTKLLNVTDPNSRVVPLTLSACIANICEHATMLNFYPFVSLGM
jgi:hypothetical protein